MVEKQVEIQQSTKVKNSIAENSKVDNTKIENTKQPMVDTVNITINGRATQVPETMTILAAAQSLGIKIPTLCFLWGTNDVGACRVCCVEVAGYDQLVSACNNLVAEGMDISTNSPKTRASRRMNVELILSQHDVQCTSCVRAGNCELRILANDLNITDTRFSPQIEPFEWNTDIPLIRDASKCIKCMRCVKVCQDVQATDIWDLKNRATRTTIGVRGGRLIEESDCALCGQCIVRCPVGALRERDDTERVLDYLADPDLVTVVQVAPSVRAAWGEQLGLTAEQATVKRLVAALKAVGFDYVFDTDFTADLTIMEEGSEFIERFTHRDQYSWPMFTSCCPAWVRWVKAHYPEFIDNLSTAKSPQQMFGSIAKTYFAEKTGIDPKRIRCISIMPCLAKKHECDIPAMDDAGAGRDVDLVLTVREMGRLLKSEFIDIAALDEVDFDSPLGIGSGAGEIFGATGGVMEAALRSAYYLVTGDNPDPDAFAGVRGLDGWKEANFEVPGAGTVRIAVASGLGNTRKLLEAIKAGEVAYDFVEIMSCPGGCVNGGGQPITSNLAAVALRSRILYGLDKHNEYRFSHENPVIKQVYQEFLGSPLKERSHHLLHTDHRAWHMPNEDGADAKECQCAGEKCADDCVCIGADVTVL
ncbi:MAG: [FeFe] hydrogenase, group A [Coriobacteriales bacterium]|jgi:NADH-quinone oxidoreductase subunit G|nr:[FeFe] hydrogenase, group A [Coriobacteriales bacterium]